MQSLSTDHVVRALTALAQHTRLAIFRLLVQQGPEGLSVGMIARHLNVIGTTLSFHLKELANAELIEPRQDGRFIYYCANYERMNGLLAYMVENCCQGQECTTQCAPKPRSRLKRA